MNRVRLGVSSLLGALVLAAGVLVLAAGAHAAPVFVLTGNGWGHGIGLSQHGSHGFALEGWTHAAILEHYYTGASVTGGHGSDTVRVLVASERASLTLASASSFEAGGASFAAGTYAVAPAAGQVLLTRSGTTTALASPATVTPGSAALELAGVAYRGSLVLAASPAGTNLSALNELTRQAYLQGVVPREMPASWHAEALAAQAVAARTYSLATPGHCVWRPVASSAGQRVFCPDTRDQVYGGRSAETAATNAAVQTTAGKAVTFGGAPVQAYFFSTSGGKTAAKDGEWGPPPVPYLVSVDDPFDRISPHHRWGPSDAETDCAGTTPDCVFTAAQIQMLLELAERPVDLRVAGRNGSGRVAALEASSSTRSASFAGTTARTKLGLRSTWFSVGVLSLKSSASTSTYGDAVTLSGLARSGGTAGWGTATLQRRPSGATTWTTVGPALPNGDWTRSVRPRRTTDYRVVAGNATGEAQRVSVRTRVAFNRPAAPFRRLAGTVRPASAGVVVTLARRRADGSWATVGTTRTRADGSFRFTVSKRGTYRARADAGAGLLAGSAVVTVPQP